MMSKLLIDEYPLQVLPSLAVAIGLNEAVFLQQLHYWLTPTVKYKPHYREYEGISRPWIYNTYHAKSDKKGTGWQANFPFWSVRTIKRIVSSLKDKELIIVTDQFNAASSNRTLWYTIDYDKLAIYEKASTSGTLDSDNLALSDSDNLALSRGGQLGTPMTETTAKNTTDFNGSAKNSQTSSSDILDPVALANEICTICVLGETISKDKRQEVKDATITLHPENVTQPDLNNFKAWWYDHTWKGQRNQSPEPKDICNEWGRFEAARVVKVPSMQSDGDNGIYI